jgi:hypothetical protein
MAVGGNFLLFARYCKLGFYQKGKTTCQQTIGLFMRLLFAILMLFCQSCSQFNLEKSAYSSLQDNQRQRCIENQAPCMGEKKFDDYQRERQDAVRQY